MRGWDIIDVDTDPAEALRDRLRRIVRLGVPILEPVLKDYVVFWCDGGACALFSFDQFRDGGQACGRQGIVRGLVIMVVVVR